MAQRVRDILLKISGDASDAQRALEETANELKEFDNTTYEATVDVDTTPADLKMQAAQKAVEDYDGMVAEAKLDLQVAGAEAQLKRLQTNLANLQKKETSPKVDIAIAGTLAKIERVEASLDKLKQRRVDINVDVDVDRDRVGLLAAGGIGSAAEGVGLFVSAASRGIPVIGGLGQLLVQLGLSGAALAPAFLTAAAALGAAMIPAMVLAAGAAFALVASLGSAAAAVGVLATALAAAFGPVILVGVAAMSRFEKVLEAVNADASKLKETLKDLTPAERSLALALRDLKDVIGTVFRPATNAVFRGMADAVKDLAAFARDRRVRSGFQGIGEAIGNMFRAFGRELRRPEIRNAFQGFARAGAQIIRTLTPVFSGLFSVIVRVARVAMPFLLEAVQGIGRAFRAWAGDVGRAGIQRFVDRVRASFRAWLGVAKELVLIIKALFVGSAKEGDRLVDVIRDILRRFRSWIEQDPERIYTFFHTSIDLAVALLRVLEKVIIALDRINSVKGPSGIDLLNKIPFLEKIKGPSLIDILTKQTGGPVPGFGRGDRVPAMLEPGEFVLRRSVAQSIGVGRLNLLNAGNLAALGGGRGMVIQQQDIHLPAAPGHDQLGDPRHQAVQLARELRRRGQVGLAGGGYP